MIIFKPFILKHTFKQQNRNNCGKNRYILNQKQRNKAGFIAYCHQSLSHFNSGPASVCVGLAYMQAILNLEELTVDQEQLFLHSPLSLHVCLKIQLSEPISVVNIENNTVQALMS